MDKTELKALLDDMSTEELEVHIQSVEIYSNHTQKLGDPDDLAGFSFDLMT